VRTWATDGTVWPRDLVPTDIPEARILTFGYDSNVTQFSSEAVSQNRMESHAADLCAYLVDLRATTGTVGTGIVFFQGEAQSEW
jgi:hypothetical protein